MNVLLDGHDFNKRWAFNRFKDFISDKTRVLIVPFAFHDDWIKNKDEWYQCYNKTSGKFYPGLVRPFLEFGTKETNIKFLNYFVDTAEDLSRLLKDTELMYFIGGFPDKMISRLIELDMLKIINQYRGIVMGWSAGASIQSEMYYIGPDCDYKEYILQNGLSHIRGFAVQVHYKGRKEQRECIDRFINTTGYDVYLLRDESAIIYDGERLELLGNVEKYK